MKYQIVFLPEAGDDSDEIRIYLSQYYKNTAKHFFEHLKAQISFLKSNPYIGRQYPERPSYRRLVVEDYLVFYKVNDDKALIEIHRILHGSKEIDRYIE